MSLAENFLDLLRLPFKLLRYKGVKVQTLFNGFIIQLILSAILFLLLAFFIIKNARLKKEIEAITSSSKKIERE